MKSYKDFINENEQLDVNPTIKMFRDAWKQVFPNSTMTVKQGIIGRDVYAFAGKLAKDKSECPNGFIENDPLNYAGIFEDGVFKETQGSMFVKPTQPHLVYSSVKLRAKTTKDVTFEKLVKRFTEVRKFVMDNKDNLKNPAFNIDEK